MAVETEEADGRELQESDYPKLFETIGHRFGKPRGGWFRLPNLQGYFLRGHDPDGKVDPDVQSRAPQANSRISSTEVGTVQGFCNASHTHAIRDNYNDRARSKSTPGSGNIVRAKHASDADLWTVPGGKIPTATSVIELNQEECNDWIKSTGGRESRPVNVAVRWIIRVE